MWRRWFWPPGGPCQQHCAATAAALVLDGTTPLAAIVVRVITLQSGDPPREPATAYPHTPHSHPRPPTYPRLRRPCSYHHGPGGMGCFERAKDYLGGFNVPTATLLGNHDLEGAEFETDEENLAAWQRVSARGRPAAVFHGRCLFDKGAEFETDEENLAAWQRVSTVGWRAQQLRFWMMLA